MGNAGLFRRRQQADGRLAHGFAAQRERAEVHGDEGACGAEVEEGLQGLFGAGVDGAIAVGEVGTDGQQRDLRLQAMADLFETMEVGGVAGVVDAVAAAAQDVTAVVTVGVVEHARAPVAAGRHDDFDLLFNRVGFEGGGLPPFEFGDAAEAEFFDQVAHSQGNDCLRRDAGEAFGVAHDPAQGGEIEVVHVRMCEQYRVDGRQVLEEHAGAALAAQQDQACGEDGVDKEVAAGDLDEEGRVADEGDAELAGIDETRRNRRSRERQAVAFTHHGPELFQLTNNRWVVRVRAHILLDVGYRFCDAELVTACGKSLAGKHHTSLESVCGAHFPLRRGGANGMNQSVDAEHGTPQNTPHHHAQPPDHADPHATEQRVWAQVQHCPLASMWDLQGVSVKDVAKGTWDGLNDDNLFGRASELAYAFFSAIFPALIAMSSLMGLVAQSSGKLYVTLLGKIGHLIPPTAFALVTGTFQQTTNASTRGKVTFGLLFALFSASVGISALQDTLNTVYKVRETRPFWKARLQAIGLTMLVSVVVIGALLVLFAGDFSARHLEGLFRGAMVLAVAIRGVAWAIACVMMVLSFEVMYYFCPDVQNSKWRWFTPGGLIGLGGWIAGSVALRIYLHYFNSFSVMYGSLGAVIILLLWFYLTGAMILLGGEVNSEIEHAVAEKKLRSGVCPPPPDSAMERVKLDPLRKVR